MIVHLKNWERGSASDYCEFSVIRFGEILPLGQNFKVLGNFVRGYLAKFRTYFGNFLYCWANFHYFKAQKFGHPDSDHESVLSLLYLDEFAYLLFVCLSLFVVAYLGMYLPTVLPTYLPTNDKLISPS